ncbi:hypothetical protein FRC01_001118, partial [Tulasnella sp. 417]
MAAADSSRFGDPRSGYAQHPPPSLPHPYAHHHHQHHQQPAATAAAVPAGIPQQSPAYHPSQQQQQVQHQHQLPPHHHHQAPPPPHPPYGQLPPAAGAASQGGHLDAAVAAVPNGRLHPSYASMPQPHQHQQHQHHPQHPHQQFYAQPPPPPPQHHPSQQQQQQQHHHHQQHHQQHQQHHHHPSSMGHGPAIGDPSGSGGSGAMGGGAGAPGGPQSHQMAPLLPPGGAGVYVPAPPPVTFPVEPQLDFTQIFRLFNMTVSTPTTTESMNDVDPSSRGRRLANLPPSTWNSMLQSALDGLRSIDPMLAEKYVAAARDIQVPEVAEVVVDVAGPGGPGGVNGTHHPGGPGGSAAGAGVNGNGVVDGDEEGPEGKKRRQDDKGAEPQECLTCHAKSSPEWRRGPF